jgi:redox-sensitive bicupin YhaK (pirin superfamily)
MKKILGVYGNDRPHWVGNGFPVRSLFSYDGHGQALSPFLLLDYAGPRDFPPTTEQRGVGTHPHRGFETVTIVYSGEVAHRDSSGGGGTIGPGDVQWMTAGSGILHEEFHSPAYARSGGPFEMVQLWVNLPARHKMTAPRYQGLLAADIPTVALADDAGTLRVIAGEFAGRKGPAQTFSPVEVWDLRLRDGKRADFAVPDGHTLAVVVLAGTVRVNGEAVVREAQAALLDQPGTTFTLEANGDAKLLVLAGAPLNEPIEGYGPFVMNTAAEIRAAIADYNSGHFGRMPA